MDLNLSLAVRLEGEDEWTHYTREELRGLDDDLQPLIEDPEESEEDDLDETIVTPTKSKGQTPRPARTNRSRFNLWDDPAARTNSLEILESLDCPLTESEQERDAAGLETDENFDDEDISPIPETRQSTHGASDVSVASPVPLLPQTPVPDKVVPSSVPAKVIRKSQVVLDVNMSPILINCRSLKPKLTSLTNNFDMLKATVALLTETWFTKSDKQLKKMLLESEQRDSCLLYTSPSPRD